MYDLASPSGWTLCGIFEITSLCIAIHSPVHLDAIHSSFLTTTFPCLRENKKIKARRSAASGGMDAGKQLLEFMSYLEMEFMILIF